MFLSLVVSLLFVQFLGEIRAQHVITVKNNCKSTLWIGFIGQNNQPSPKLPGQSTGGGFELGAGRSVSVTLGNNWEGRIWPRTGCAQGRKCQTGDCRDGQLECGLLSGNTPATLAEFRFNGNDKRDTDFYDISLVDGFNLPVTITPFEQNQKTGRPDKEYDCTPTSCSNDLNVRCPQILRELIGNTVVGCKSACAKFGTDEYCCRKPFDSAERCKASAFANEFKKICPQAYSYAFDDKKSTWTCKSLNSGYVVTWCP